MHINDINGQRIELIVYSPLIFLGYFITKAILNADTDKILWIALIIIFAFIFYFIIYFLKGVLIALKHNAKFILGPAFYNRVIITCVLPEWIVFNPLENIIAHYADTNHKILTWIFAGAFGLYVYSRYHFLTNIAPTSAFPYYQRGIIMTMHLLNLTKNF